MLAVCFYTKLLAGMFTSLRLVFWPSQLSTHSWVNAVNSYFSTVCE